MKEVRGAILVKVFQDDVLIYRDSDRMVIRDWSIKSYTGGLTDPNKRVTEKQWLDAFANLMSGQMSCPSRGAEVFIYEIECLTLLIHTGIVAVPFSSLYQSSLEKAENF